MPRGRKPIGDRAMTDAERQQRYRERKDRREATDVVHAAYWAGRALGRLKDAVLKSDAPVDATQELRDEISRMQDAVGKMPAQVRALVATENA